MRITIVSVHQTISLSFPQTIFPPSLPCSHKTHFFPQICGELYDGRWLLLRGHYYTTVGFVGFHPITVNIDVRFCSLQDSEREEDKEAVIVLWGYYGPMLNRHQSIHMIYHQTRLRDTKLITLGSQYYQKTRAQNIGGKEQPGTIIQSCQWRVMMVPSPSSTFNITSFLSAFVRNKIENKIHWG